VTVFGDIDNLAVNTPNVRFQGIPYDSPASIFFKLAPEYDYAFLLESRTGLGNTALYSYIGFDPIATVRVNGVITPDLPVEEATLYKEIAMRYGLDTIFLAAQSTSEARLERLLHASSGFLYLISANGVTGARNILEEESIAFIKRTATSTRGRVPLAVGFGLSLQSHVSQVIDNGANAAIIGSAFSQIVEQNLGDSDQMLKMLRQRAQTLKRGLT